jgi:general secretion pathway protein N
MATRSQILLTAALGAVTAWSALFALAGVAGLAGRYSALPDDPSLVSPLPEINLEQAVSTLEGAASYAAIGDRPLFNLDRRPLPPVSAPDPNAPVESTTPAPPEFILTSVVKSGDKQFAIVQHTPSGNSQSVAVGAQLQAELTGWTLVELAPRGAVFEGGSGRKSFELRVFDGTGGQPPTPIDVPPVQAAVAQDGAAPPPVGADGQPQQAAADTPEARAEMIRRRIEERRRQMREEAERARQ